MIPFYKCSGGPTCTIVLQQQISKPSPTGPHPRLLGSLNRLLYRHSTSGFGIDTLCFEEVLADDPEVSGPEYVDVPPGMLPELQGGDFWWKTPPSSGESTRPSLPTFTLKPRHRTVSLGLPAPPTPMIAIPPSTKDRNIASAPVQDTLGSKGGEFSC